MATALWNHGHPGIYIADDGNAEFATAANNALNSINSKPIGQMLLKTIAASCLMYPDRSVIIEMSVPAWQQCAIPTEKSDDAFRKSLRQPGMGGAISGAKAKVVATDSGETLTMGNGVKIKYMVPGEGCGAFVRWNPNITDVAGKKRPPFIALAHELVHAYHYVHGACYRGLIGFAHQNVDSGLAEEEKRTVGLGEYADEIPCENAIRAEHGVAKRTEYTEGNDFSKVQATVFA